MENRTLKGNREIKYRTWGQPSTTTFFPWCLSQFFFPSPTEQVAKFSLQVSDHSHYFGWRKSERHVPYLLRHSSYSWQSAKALIELGCWCNLGLAQKEKGKKKGKIRVHVPKSLSVSFSSMSWSNKRSLLAALTTKIGVIYQGLSPELPRPFLLMLLLHCDFCTFRSQSHSLTPNVLWAHPKRSFRDILEFVS